LDGKEVQTSEMVSKSLLKLVPQLVERFGPIVTNAVLLS
jgi:hypothetical protein